MKKLNKKAMFLPSINMAEQNAAVAGGGYAIYILATFLVASILYITGSVVKLGCSCTCTCYDNKRTMLAAAGYGNNAVTMAR